MDSISKFSVPTVTFSSARASTIVAAEPTETPSSAHKIAEKSARLTSVPQTADSPPNAVAISSKAEGVFA